MQIQLAKPSEFNLIQGFYYKLIDDMQGMDFIPGWQKGVYPSDAQITDALNNNELYVGIEDGVIVSAMRVNHAATEGYETINWSIDAKGEEVTIIHMLGVAVGLQKKGVGRAMVQFVIDKAKEECQKCLRLDVLEGNIPAHRLYESIGFNKVSTLKLFYEDTGLTNYTLYEYNLKEE